MNGFDCGGTSIITWDDGSSSNYGTLTGTSNCEATCGMHIECAGFVYNAFSGACGYWKRGPLNLLSSSNWNCYEKLKGSMIIHVSRYYDNRNCVNIM